MGRDLKRRSTKLIGEDHDRSKHIPRPWTKLKSLRLKWNKIENVYFSRSHSLAALSTLTCAGPSFLVKTGEGSSFESSSGMSRRPHKVGRLSDQSLVRRSIWIHEFRQEIQDVRPVSAQAIRPIPTSDVKRTPDLEVGTHSNLDTHFCSFSDIRT